MTRASNIGEHSPHCIGAENDPAVRRYNWRADSFPDLTQSDCIWAEAIQTSCLWNEWGPSGEVQDVLFLCLIATGVWDSQEEGRQLNVEIKTMRYAVAIGGCLMMRALEQDYKVGSYENDQCWY